MRQKVTLASTNPVTQPKRQDESSDVNRMVTSASNNPLECGSEFRNLNCNILQRMIPSIKRADTDRSKIFCLSNPQDNSDVERGEFSSYPLSGKARKDEPVEDDLCEDFSGKSQRKTFRGCSKVNENMAGAGALRYALHLRFICPFPKKGSKLAEKRKSDCRTGQHGIDLDKERRFYLYNDLRVVFPQRHSDYDEGKVPILSCLYESLNAQ